MALCSLFVDVENPAGGCPTYEDRSKGICFQSANRDNIFQTAGALIGGPKTATDAGDAARTPYSQEGWNDWRTDWIGSEQTLDYNAHYTMALAAAIELPASFWTGACGGAQHPPVPVPALLTLCTACCDRAAGQLLDRCVRRCAAASVPALLPRARVAAMHTFQRLPRRWRVVWFCAAVVGEHRLCVLQVSRLT